MKESGRRNTGGKERKKATAGKGRNPEPRSSREMLGLDSAVFMCKNLLAQESLDDALNAVSNYLIDLFDLEHAAIVLRDLKGMRTTIRTVSSREDNFHYLKGFSYENGSSPKVDAWLETIFSTKKPITLGFNDIEAMLMMLAEEMVFAEDTFTSIIRKLEAGEKRKTTLISQRSRSGEPLMILALTPEGEFTETEKELVRKFSETLALAVERRLEIRALDKELSKYKALIDTCERQCFLITYGRLEFFSERLPDLLGAPAAKVKGGRLEDFMIEEDAADLHRMIDRFLHEEDAPPKKYYHVYRLAGSGAEVEIHLNSIDFKGSKAIQGTLENVSKSRMLEQNALDGKHLESVATLAGGVAHDYNNLIGAMMGYASLVRNSLPEYDERVMQLRKIEEAGARATRLTRQLLSISRKGKYKLEVMDVGEVLARATRSCILPMDHISVSRISRAEMINIEGDPAQIYEAFLNICMNARESMPDGGVINISIENQRMNRDHPAFKEGMKTGDYVQIKVKDHGAGMESEVLRRAADPFFTTKKDKNRKGLGIPASIGIIEGHRGRMLMSSNVGDGTEVQVFLPVTDRELEATVHAEEGVCSGPRRVLVIDDEEIILSLASDMLRKLGYNVATALSGYEAIEIVREQKVDLVLLDLVMPEMNGQETFHRLREIDPDLPVIISSGYCEDSVIQKILNEGAISFLVKPYRLKDMSRVLHEAVRINGPVAGK